MGFEQRWAIAEDVTSQRIGDETVVLNMTTGDYLGLRGESCRAWEMLQAQADRGQIVDAIAQEFEAPRERVDSDFTHFLDDLRRRHLIV